MRCFHWNLRVYDIVNDFFIKDGQGNITCILTAEFKDRWENRIEWKETSGEEFPLLLSLICHACAYTERGRRSSLHASMLQQRFSMSRRKRYLECGRESIYLYLNDTFDILWRWKVAFDRDEKCWLKTDGCGNFLWPRLFTLIKENDGKFMDDEIPAELSCPRFRENSTDQLSVKFNLVFAKSNKAWKIDVGSR
jgi:hypothetical protein